MFSRPDVLTTFHCDGELCPLLPGWAASYTDIHSGVIPSQHSKLGKPVNNRQYFSIWTEPGNDWLWDARCLATGGGVQCPVGDGDNVFRLSFKNGRN